MERVVGLKMQLEERRYLMDEWNGKIMPLVENGTLVEEKNSRPRFLMIWQVFGGVLRDKRGNRFDCSGWWPTGNLSGPYVEVRKI